MLSTVKKISPKNKKTMIIGIIGIVVMIIGGFMTYNLLAANDEGEMIYQTAKVKQGDLLVTLENSGVLQYIDEKEITSNVSGMINQIFVQKEMEIGVGDPILIIDDGAIRLQLEQAYNELAIAKLKLSELLQTTVDQMDRVSVEELGIVRAPIEGRISHSLQEEMSISTNNVVFSTVDQNNITFKVSLFPQDAEQIKKGQSVNIQLTDFMGSTVTGTVEKISETAQSNGVAMVHDLWIKVANPGLLTKGMSGTASFTTSANNEITSDGVFIENAEIKTFPKINGKIKKVYVESGDVVKAGTPILHIDTTSLINQVETQKISIKNTELKIKQLEEELIDFTIKATSGGIVKEIFVTPNQTINSNSKIIKVASKELVAKITIDELDINKVKLGQEATLVIPAISNEEIIGTVNYISDTGLVKDGVTTYEIFIAVPVNENLKSGMTVDASIILEQAVNTYLVPTTSIIDVKGGKAIRVLEGEEINVKKVEVGISNDTMTQIISGLAPTDIIITSLTIPTKTDNTSSSGTSSLIPSNVSVPGISRPGGGGTSGK